MSRTVFAPMKWVARKYLGEAPYRRLAECYKDARQALHPLYRSSVRRMAELKDAHRGERCFILGNGPSLRRTDLSLLRRERTFGLNRIYLLFDELNFVTTYHVTVNRLVIEQCGQEIAALPCTKFINWNAREFIKDTSDTAFIRMDRGPRFVTDITRAVGTGATVTFVALQIAYYLGFQQVILVGVDHNFQTKGPPSKTVVSQGDDPNHFSPSYFGKGFRWQLPDLETSEIAYQVAKWEFERSGREIVDATVDGKLQIFRKVDYISLFDEQRATVTS